MRASISMQWTILREINPFENDVRFLKIFQLVKTEESSSKIFQIKWQNDFYLKASFEKVLLTHSNLKWLEINPFLSKLMYLCRRHLKKNICWKQHYISIFKLYVRNRHSNRYIWISFVNKQLEIRQRHQTEQDITTTFL